MNELMYNWMVEWSDGWMNGWVEPFKAGPAADWTIVLVCFLVLISSVDLKSYDQLQGLQCDNKVPHYHKIINSNLTAS